MLPKDKTTSKATEPDHLIVDYINGRLISLKWAEKELATNSGISQGEISKILGGVRKGLKAKTFYSIYTAFDDSCTKATTIVYPDLNLKLNKYVPKERNAFGQYMQQYEESKNSTEEIAEKTGINENRLKDLYFRKAAPEAYELLLIEKAIGKKQGQLFEELYG